LLYSTRAKTVNFIVGGFCVLSNLTKEAQGTLLKSSVSSYSGIYAKAGKNELTPHRPAL